MLERIAADLDTLQLGADGITSSAGTTVTVRKSDRVSRKLNALALILVPLLPRPPSYKSVPKNAGYFRAGGRGKRFCGGAEEVNPASAS